LLGSNPLASIKTFLSRTKFNQQRSTDPILKQRFYHLESWTWDGVTDKAIFAIAFDALLAIK
jgi:hypothetical protein